MTIEKFNRLLCIDDAAFRFIEASVLVTLEDGGVLACRGSRDKTGRLLLHLPDEAFTGLANRVLVDAGEGDNRVQAVFAVGPEAIEGRLERVSQGFLRGWCSLQMLDSALEEIDFSLSVDGYDIPATVTFQYRRDLLERSLNGGFDGFTVSLPSFVFDGDAHEFVLRVRGTALKSTFETYRFQPLGRLETAEPGRVAGWCYELGATPNEPLQLQVITDSGAILEVQADRPAAVEDGERGDRRACDFTVSLAGGARTVRIAPTFAPNIDLFRPSVFVPMVDQVEAVSRIAAAVRSGTALERSDAQWLRSVGFDAILAALRSGGIHGPARVAGTYSVARQEAVTAQRDMVTPQYVTIVVPVYDDLDATHACLQSLAASELPKEARVVIIDDATPNADLAIYLGQVCPAHGFSLQRHHVNLGFVATVNEGIVLAGRDDVVLLNADTKVPPGWLQRLRALAEKHPDAGSITPMSNNATILSWPLPNEENTCPSLDEVIRLDRLFQEQNKDRVVDLPTGHGFCMYLKRTALDEVGVFDPIWGRGYGEENDWCLRASAHGFRHLAACDTFVAHEGSKSFGDSKKALVEKNADILSQRYPEYYELIQNFMRRDPLNDARNAVSLARLSELRADLTLHLVNHLGGGVQRYVLDTSISQYKDGVLPLFLTRVQAADLVADPDYEIRSFSPVLHLRFSASRIPDVISHLEAAGLTTINIHTLAGVDFRILPSLFGASAEITTTLHDYSWTCPRVFLLQGRSKYCGQPPSAICDSCIAKFGPHPDIEFQKTFDSVSEYRLFTGSILRQSDAVLAVSDDVSRRIKQIHPGLSIDKLSGLDLACSLELKFPRPRSGQRRVAVPGAIGDHKGYELLLDTARVAMAAHSELCFVVVGFTQDDEALRTIGNVEITGPFPPGDGVRLLIQSRAEIGLLLSPWPETFSYTLSDCWQAALPVACLDIGAPADRIRERRGGWLLSPESDGSAVLEALECILSGADERRPSNMRRSRQ
ncbi:glycosyltransferase [Methylobacterium sp. WL103]|uniref:glycosyltransferase n=1 Tax=Methylobacterium sp. WL103 TaxID=2603891 RepID=UPI0011C8539E|nr:glycosyltransferase [Methylobacterium sp. WL103]TXN07168.1 glycosyltransferase [Methylobacterium sp. WL103]